MIPATCKVPVTSSWSVKLTEEYTRIGISRGPPRGQRGFRTYRPLMPGAWFRTATPEQFYTLYMAQLDALDAALVIVELNILAAGRTPALLCFERPPPDPHWCHRALVAAWLMDTLNLDVVEYGHEFEGAGWHHPKLPAGRRRSLGRA